MIRNQLDNLIGMVLSAICGLIINYFFEQRINLGFIVMAVIFVLLYLIAVTAFKFTQERKRREGWMKIVKNPVPFKGLIAAVSKQSTTTPAESAIIHHLPTLTHCWLLYSSDSEKNYLAIKQKYQQKKAGIDRYEGDDGHEIYIDGKQLIDIDNIQEAFNAVKLSYQDAKDKGLKEEEVILDFTGGTANVTAAMTLVSALSKKRKTEFLKPKRRNEQGQAIPEEGSDPLIIDLIIPGE